MPSFSQRRAKRFSVSSMCVYDFGITQRDTARPDLATTLSEAPNHAAEK